MSKYPPGAPDDRQQSRTNGQVTAWSGRHSRYRSLARACAPPKGSRSDKMAQFLIYRVLGFEKEYLHIIAPSFIRAGVGASSPQASPGRRSPIPWVSAAKGNMGHPSYDVRSPGHQTTMSLFASHCSLASTSSGEDHPPTRVRRTRSRLPLLQRDPQRTRCPARLAGGIGTGWSTDSAVPL
jgi:hypothetical protein